CSCAARWPPPRPDRHQHMRCMSGRIRNMQQYSPQAWLRQDHWWYWGEFQSSRWYGSGVSSSYNTAVSFLFSGNDPVGAMLRPYLRFNLETDQHRPLLGRAPIDV